MGHHENRVARGRMYLNFEPELVGLSQGTFSITVRRGSSVEEQLCCWTFVVSTRLSCSPSIEQAHYKCVNVFIQMPHFCKVT